jgi:hypothetical protein
MLNEKMETFEVLELEDGQLQDVVGGGLALNIDCDTTTNQGCNTVAGCGGTKQISA